MPCRLLVFLFIAVFASSAFADDENLFAMKIRRPGVDLTVQELIRNRSNSTVQSLQRVTHSRPARAALVEAMRELARERGAKYFHIEAPYAGTVAGELRVVHFYRIPPVHLLRRLYSAEGPRSW